MAEALPETSPRRVIVVAPSGSGGALTHLAEVVPRLRLHPRLRIEVHAPAKILLRAFGTAGEPWMHPNGTDHRGARLAWELLDLPSMCRRDPAALVYAPFGPHLNLACMPQTIWSARNIIPLLEPRTWEISNADRPRALALRYLFGMSARVSRAVICVSEHARARLLALAPAARIRVIPHGSIRAAGSASDPRILALLGREFLLCVGQPTPYRRIRELLLGYAALAQRIRLPPLVLVGEPLDVAYGRECERLAAPLVREGRVIQLGRLASDDALALTGAAHTVIYPSVHEDCPNCVLEALAMSRVLVCADIPATREIAAGAALFVQDPRPDSIALALERALFDESLRTKLRLEASKVASRYSWERTAALTAEALERA